MEFIWMDYGPEYEEWVETLFDSEAIKFTGCDEGFRSFCDYWHGELGGDHYFCKVIFKESCLLGVIALAKSSDGVFTVQEVVISPEYRGLGYGTRVLKELLQRSASVIGQEITVAEAVIFPENIASQKAFLKAGFVHTGTHPDGEVLYYQYTK